MADVRCASCGQPVTEDQSPSHPDEWFCEDCHRILEEIEVAVLGGDGAGERYNFTRLVLQKIADGCGMTYEQLREVFMAGPKQSEPPQTGDAIAGRFYIHGKSGGRYICLGVGYNSNNTPQEEGRVEVYYRGPSGLMHNRALSEWSGLVEWPDGVMRPRFWPAE